MNISNDSDVSRVFALWLEEQVNDDSHSIEHNKVVSQLRPAITAASLSGLSNVSVPENSSSRNISAASSVHSPNSHVFSHIPASTTIVVYDGVSHNPEDPSQEIVPVCSHGRALELILLEAGIPYSRHLINAVESEKSMTKLHKALLSELESISDKSLCFPALRVKGHWVVSSTTGRTDIVDDLLRKAKQQDPKIFMNMDSMRGSIPPAVAHVSSNKQLSTVGWKYICAKTGSSDEKDALSEMDQILRPWNDTMRGRIDSTSSMMGELDAVRSWGPWSIGDCFLASYIFLCSTRFAVSSAQRF